MGGRIGNQDIGGKNEMKKGGNWETQHQSLAFNPDRIREIRG